MLNWFSALQMLRGDINLQFVNRPQKEHENSLKHAADKPQNNTATTTWGMQQRGNLATCLGCTENIQNNTQRDTETHTHIRTLKTWHSQQFIDTF